jgi:histidinol-phosphatase
VTRVVTLRRSQEGTIDVMTDHAFGPAWSASHARAAEPQLREWLAFALEACDVADEIARRHFRRDLDLERKPDRTFVTIADQGIEREIRTRIQARYPGSGLVGEEYGVEAGHGTTRWIIDPIDGTHNFIRGVPLFGTLLAVEHEGELQVGVMSAPALHERWYAYRGGGAWNVGLDGERRIHVSRVAALEDSQVLYGSARDNVTSGLMPGFDGLIAASWRERGFGDFWGYALVAEGAAEVMLETGLSPWDMAAPLIIIEEAGGRVTDAFGERRIDAPSFVGSNGLLHDEVLRRLRTAA